MNTSAATPEQKKLVQQKMELLQKARSLQSQLATARAELTAIDQQMVNAGFDVPVLNCW
jgi:hypothetical protein